MLRPNAQQTHVGRFFDKVADGRLRRLLPHHPAQGDGELRLVHVARGCVWLLPIVGAARLVPLVDAPRTRSGALVREAPVIRQTLLALALTALLGYALNDSGIAIPALMAVVFECARVYFVLVPARLDRAARSPSSRGTASTNPQ